MIFYRPLHFFSNGSDTTVFFLIMQSLTWSYAALLRLAPSVVLTTPTLLLLLLCPRTMRKFDVTNEAKKAPPPLLGIVRVIYPILPGLPAHSDLLERS